MGYHARLGPSGAFRWSKCTMSPHMEDGLPDNGNDASRAGTAEHEAAAECLEHGRDPWDYLGREFVFLSEREEMWLEALPASRHAEIKFRVVLDEEAIERIETYVNQVRDIVSATGGTLLVENRVPIQHITGESYWSLNGQEVPEGTPGAVEVPAGGTSDAIVLAGEEFISIDYKSGQGRVTAYDLVKPEGINPITGEMEPAVLAPNDQLAMYASGGVEAYGWMGDFKRFRLIIVQPRLGAISEYSLTREELDAHIETLRQAAIEVRENPQFRPSFETCNFCKARNGCKARDEYVAGMVLDGFVSGDLASLEDAQPRVVLANELGLYYSKLEAITQWVADIHKRVYAELRAGRPVIRPDGVAYKLVQGRAGNRKWPSPEMAEFVLTTVIGLPDDKAYNRKPIGPAELEELAKAKKARKGRPAVVPVVPPELWEFVQEHYIVQEPGKPVISLATDPKPAIDLSTSGFADLSDFNDE